ncbi:hypothetical protein D4R86_02185 [bacterium]|nr:MAG: hypothetical protein D4R86_02185 [bacterium]
MKNLDLHNIRHHLVRAKLIRFIEEHWDKDIEAEIIIGNSTYMKDIVKEVLDEYKIKYKEGDFAGINMGFLKVEI